MGDIRCGRKTQSPEEFCCQLGKTFPGHGQGACHLALLEYACGHEAVLKETNE
jgi:hypothetical protein